jgi:hypothetical protein
LGLGKGGLRRGQRNLSVSHLLIYRDALLNTALRDYEAFLGGLHAHLCFLDSLSCGVKARYGSRGLGARACSSPCGQTLARAGQQKQRGCQQ